MIVKLTGYEVRFGVNVGVERTLEAIRLGRRDRYGFDGDGWGVAIDGALAELAVAKRLRRYWDAVVEDPATLQGDVGDAQVRSTKRSSGCLIVHPSDPDDAPFVFVVQRDISTYNVVGWLYGREGKEQQWWQQQTGRPAYFVPQRALRKL